MEKKMFPAVFREGFEMEKVLSEETKYLILERYVNAGTTSAICYILENGLANKPTEAAGILFSVRNAAGGC